MGFVSASDQGILVMQNPKSGSGGGRLNPRKIWNRTRSKSQPRSSSSSSSFGSWTSLGNGTWITSGGRQVVLTDTNLFNLTEVEASALRQLALAKLQAMDLGCSIQIPKTQDDVGVEKRKRKALALKKRSLTTGFFENSGKSKAECSRTASQSTGLVFGVSLTKCIENDRANRLSIVPLREVGNLLDSRLVAGSASAEDITNERYLSASRGICGSQSSCNIPLDLPGDKKFFGKDNEESCESLKLGGKSYSMSGLCFIDSLQDWPNSIDGEVDTSPHIPHIVNTCFSHLETNGLHRLGIFRISSSKKRIKQLREDFDCGKEVHLSKDYCPHDIATLLKEYFRDLPEPLLTRELYMAFVGSQRIRNRRQQMDCLSNLIQLLPFVNRDTLWALLKFLNKVACNALDHRAETGEWVTGNKMDSHNLATLFGPNILHMAKPNLSQSEFQVESSKRAEERIEVIKVVRTMIDNYKELFEVSGFLLDELYHRIHLQNPDLLGRLLTVRLLPNEIEIDPDTGSSVCSETTSISHLPIDVSMELSPSFVVGVHSGESSSSGHWERSLVQTGSLPDHEAMISKHIERNSSNESIASARRPDRGGSLGREIYSKAEAVTSRLFRRRGKSTTRDGHEDSPQRFEESSHQWFKKKCDKSTKRDKSQTRKREPSESDGSGSSDHRSSTAAKTSEIVDVIISNSRSLMRPETSPKLQSVQTIVPSQSTTAQQVSIIDIRRERLHVPDVYDKRHTVPSSTDTGVISASLTLKVPLARSKTGPALAFGQGIDFPFIEDVQSEREQNRTDRTRTEQIANQRKRFIDKRHRQSNVVQESEVAPIQQSSETSKTLTVPALKSKMSPLATSASTSAIPAMRRRSKELSQGIESSSSVTTSKQSSGSQNRHGSSGAAQPRVYQRQRSRTRVTESSGSNRVEEINNNPPTSNARWPQETWKRWEIISSEHTEQETVV
ncbi:hypothetical protein CHUAL_001595 [Chamberlinius hualienensis]